MTGARKLGPVEFIALMAATMAVVAFAIDSTLPAFPTIIAEMTPDAPNHVQLLITTFMLGIGIGTLVVGPLSDAYGRKPVLIGCAVLYSTGALLAWQAPSLEPMLAARLVQGLGAAGARVVTVALVRDLYKGREMARVVSFIMMVFTIVPAMAPMIGSVIIGAFGWRALFLAYVLMSAITCLWLVIRQEETLPPVQRRPLRIGTLISGMAEIMRNRVVMMTIIAQGFAFGCMFSTISSIQQIFTVRFDAEATFTYWFFAIAVVAGFSSLLNAALVVKVGMRILVTSVLTAEFLISLSMAVLNGFDLLPEGVAFAAQILWTMSMFGMLGLCMGNLNALALEPLGHLAGLGASVSGCIATIMAVVLSLPVGQSFDGTNIPLAIGMTVYTGIALTIMLALPKRH
ncbi:MFS transporter [Falsirhodobacter algicola]|uniref:MFS transporter n=1 Tax=Falsirhodobacter algicola TaxID=2692330 RepID=A0A8J8MSA8_9RHOB|nr:MFS transporter [Falsirhodobacter algicola]QUS35466.1 MFS transporter [Falsirhodobacter algicola]